MYREDLTPGRLRCLTVCGHDRKHFFQETRIMKWLTLSAALLVCCASVSEVDAGWFGRGGCCGCQKQSCCAPAPVTCCAPAPTCCNTAPSCCCPRQSLFSRCGGWFRNNCGRRSCCQKSCCAPCAPTCCAPACAPACGPTCAAPCGPVCAPACAAPAACGPACGPSCAAPACCR